MKRYPLESLVELRRHAVDEHTAQLGRHIAQTQRRELEVTKLRAEQRAVLGRASEVEATERDRAERAHASAADFHQMAMYRHGVQQTQAELERREQLAKQSLATARSNEAASRHALSEAHSANEVIDEHRARFLRRERARQEQRLEEEGQEIHAARRQR